MRKAKAKPPAPAPAASARTARSGVQVPSPRQVWENWQAIRIARSADSRPTEYPGGKAGPGVYHRLISMMPPHRVYIEAFLGGGAVMRHKRPAEHSYGIDLDRKLIDQWNDYSPRDLFTGIAGDGLSFLEKSRLTGDELVYLDPPYLMETRTSKRAIYRHTINGNDAPRQMHHRLLRIAKALPCYVMISGYNSELYRAELKGWRLIVFPAMTRAGLRDEYVWLNFAPPNRLHDYRYLGDGYRERERIRKRCRRWTGQLDRMPALERLALLSYINEDQPTYAPRRPIE